MFDCSTSVWKMIFFLSNRLRHCIGSANPDGFSLAKTFNDCLTFASIFPNPLVLNESKKGLWCLLIQCDLFFSFDQNPIDDFLFPIQLLLLSNSTRHYIFLSSIKCITIFGFQKYLYLCNDFCLMRLNQLQMDILNLILACCVFHHGK